MLPLLVLLLFFCLVIHGCVLIVFCVSLTGETDEQINIEKMTKEGVLPKQHKK